LAKTRFFYVFLGDVRLMYGLKQQNYE
jgi:hypothetical protein